MVEEPTKLAAPVTLRVSLLAGVVKSKRKSPPFTVRLFIFNASNLTVGGRRTSTQICPGGDRQIADFARRRTVAGAGESSA